jgi:hypothetical protein
MNPLSTKLFLRELWQILHRQFGMSARRLSVRFGNAPKLRLTLPELTQLPAEPPGSDVASQILAVMAEADRPVKGRAIAGRAGRKFNSHFKQVLAPAQAGATDRFHGRRLHPARGRSAG